LASIANINKKHHFLIFETDAFLISVDYYTGNQLVIRMGDKSFVFDVANSPQRTNAVLLSESTGLKWRTVFEKGGFTVGKLLNYLMLLKMKDFREALNNGSHFSREVFLAFQNEFGL
jgi:hypothetical protein